MNQTRLTATAPSPGGPVQATVIVDSVQLERATREAWDSLAGLVGSVILRKGGDRSAITWTAEPVGPQVRLVAVNGSLL